jgi:CheY-like chemotaxis protein
VDASPAPTLPRALVVGYHDADVEAVCRAIQDGDAAEAAASGPECDPALMLREVRPDVVVLVFDTIEKAAQQAESLRQVAQGPGPRVRCIVACRMEQADAAFRACRGGVFDDYVPMWPEPVDPHRMAMSVIAAARRAPPPASSVPDGDDSASKTAAAIVAPPASASGTTGILVVEDDPFAFELVAQALAVEGVTVRHACDAPSARALLRESRPALVLMDIGLPGMDGLALTAWLKSVPALADIPVVMLTGEARRETIERSRQARADGFIVKPFTREGLLAKLQPYLGRPAQARVDPASLG